MSSAPELLSVPDVQATTLILALAARPASSLTMVLVLLVLLGALPAIQPLSVLHFPLELSATLSSKSTPATPPSQSATTVVTAAHRLILPSVTLASLLDSTCQSPLPLPTPEPDPSACLAPSPATARLAPLPALQPAPAASLETTSLPATLALVATLLALLVSRPTLPSV